MESQPFDFYNHRRDVKDDLFTEAELWILSMFSLPNTKNANPQNNLENDRFTSFPPSHGHQHSDISELTERNLTGWTARYRQMVSIASNQ